MIFEEELSEINQLFDKLFFVNRTITRKSVRKIQKSLGIDSLSKDFHPPHLRLIYGTYEKKIDDHYLDKNLDQRKLNPVKLF